MTRHNLDSHISWLLSHEVTFPPTVHATNLAALTAADFEEEDFLDEDTLLDSPRAATSPPRGSRVDTNVAQEFIRPALPSSKPQLSHTTRSSVEEPMANIPSTSRSSRPGLLTQHQLSTPASTSGTIASTGSHSRTGSRAGLTGNYTAQLREERNGTPSVRSATSRPLSRVPRGFEPPQTPRQTPRPTTETKIETVDSVDLTGDDHFADSGPRSSSSDFAFGPPVVLWREDSASRAEPPTLEPQVRTSKKRKSGDLSPERSRRVVKHSSERVKASQSQSENLDGFVDIDDVPKRPKTPASHAQHSKFVQPSVELGYGMDDLEEYQITETISTVQTRTRKSISRVSSFTNGSPQRSRIVATQSANRSTESVGTIDAPPPTTTIQVAASPAAIPSISPSRKHTSTPRKSQKRRLKRTIQDSEDEEYLSDIEKRASCSPCTPIKASPRVVKASPSPQHHDLSTFSPAKRKVADFGESKPRVGSPLRPISSNVKFGKTRARSPYHRSSSTDLPAAPESSKAQSDRRAPSSSLGLDEKKLVDTFLKEPALINPYRERVTQLIAQSAVEVMAYVDEGKPAPNHLKEARKALLDQKKAYDAIDGLEKQHKDFVDQKKSMARQLIAHLDSNADSSELESQLSILTPKIRELEKEIAQLLYSSGAVNDGFGTGLDHGNASLSAETSSMHGASALLPIGSSTTGSAQVILQTQLPSLQSRLAATLDDQTVHEVLSRNSSTSRRSDSVTEIRRIPTPALQSGRAWASNETGPRAQSSSSKSRAEIFSKQPDFHREPSPLDYGFDGEDFDDLLDFEQSLQHPAETRNEIEEIVEDDFGDSQDDEEFLQVAQNFEKHQSFTEPAMPTRRPFSTETSRRPSPKGKGLQIVEKNMYSNVENLDNSDLFRHPWSNAVKRALKERFKMHGFRRHQLDVINATLSGRDVFVLMPTGGGKSLCFQLPAIIQSGKTKGVTVVISPLLSLMQDQVDHLQKLNIRAGRISSDVSAAERKTIMAHLNEEHPEQFIQLLYVSPEMISMNQNFLTLLSRLHRNKKLARIVIDEAHCVSQWGHDFRPDYVALRTLRDKFPGVPYIALTATATKNVKADVTSNLGMNGCDVFAQSFNRPNLTYEVRKKVKNSGKGRDSTDEIADMIKEKYKDQSGIIYTLSRVGCEKLADKLKDTYGITASAYHAGMEAKDKARIQKQWQSGQIQVVVATIAFGMGIDKKDVRFVVHFMIPKSLEGYYQETGRAGRDGKKAGCYLYYAYSDTAMLKSMIIKNEDGIPQEQVDRQWRMLKTMIQFCENKIDCRRQQVLLYFGENYDKAECHKSCDNCWSDTVYNRTDLTRYAQTALSIVAKVQHDQVTLLHCVDIFRGASNKKMKEFKHDQLKQFGAGKDLARGDAERLYHKLSSEGAIREESVANKARYTNTYIKLGQTSGEILTGKAKLYLDMPVATTGTAKPPPKFRSEPYPSTAVTSPLGPSSRNIQRSNHQHEDVDTEDEEDAFEPVPAPPRRRNIADKQFGPPITSDDRMAALSNIHQSVVHNFVDEAKKLEETIRNRASAKKPIFTEANLREMAIQWTVTLKNMRDIPDINVDRVETYGKQFLPLIKRYQGSYNDMMGQDDDADIDIDANHQNVIDLVTDGEDEDEEEEDDDEYEIEEGVAEAVLAAQKSPFFTENSTSSRKGYKPRAGGRAGAKSGFKPRGKGGKKYAARKSGGSTSGQSNAGVSKRTSSGSSKRSRGSSHGGSIARSFSNQGGPSRGGGSIGMMPT